MNLSKDNLFITRENEIVEEKGAYMDTSFSGDNVSVISPEIELDKGIYIVDVEYETNTSFNTSNIKIEEDTYKGVFQMIFVWTRVPTKFHIIFM